MRRNGGKMTRYLFEGVFFHSFVLFALSAEFLQTRGRIQHGAGNSGLDFECRESSKFEGSNLS